MSILPSLFQFCRIQNLHISQTYVDVLVCLPLFCRIQNLHISQTIKLPNSSHYKFCRIQNLHISQTMVWEGIKTAVFCRIQNLHISQTRCSTFTTSVSFVEFKIYISLKPQIEIWNRNFEFRYKKMDRHRSSPKAI